MKKPRMIVAELLLNEIINKSMSFNDDLPYRFLIRRVARAFALVIHDHG
jgi:hypothetical protein